MGKVYHLLALRSGRVTERRTVLTNPISVGVIDAVLRVFTVTNVPSLCFEPIFGICLLVTKPRAILVMITLTALAVSLPQSTAVTLD